MGFRDLHLFNLAMLGKQGWRLLSRPESLCARTLCGKYFHNGSFMRARKKTGSSDTWRAILKGREVLEKGLIKRVGDGNSINKWDDHWIPSNPGFKPIYPKARAEKVHEFLSPDRMSWNIRALRDNFLIHDENAVNRIPLGRLEKDTWAWSVEKHGMYIVKSAYRLLISSSRMAVLLKNNIACSSVS